MSASASTISFLSKVSLRHLPPEMTFDELKEALNNYMPFIDHFHFIPGKSPSFYPQLPDSENNSKRVANKVQATKGVITFSTPGNRPPGNINLSSNWEDEPDNLSEEDLLTRKIKLEEHFVHVLGGRFSAAYLNFTDSNALLEFSKEFDAKLIESSRGRTYRSTVRLSSLPGVSLNDSLDMSANTFGSFEESPQYAKWLEDCVKSKETQKPSLSLSYEQQSSILLEQEQILHPWKNDPNFFKNTPLISFLSESKTKIDNKRKDNSKSKKKPKAETKEVVAKIKIKPRNPQDKIEVNKYAPSTPDNNTDVTQKSKSIVDTKKNVDVKTTSDKPIKRYFSTNKSKHAM